MMMHGVANFKFLIQKLIFLKLAKKFVAFYVTGCLITISITSHSWYAL